MKRSARKPIRKDKAGNVVNDTIVLVTTDAVLTQEGTMAVFDSINNIVPTNLTLVNDTIGHFDGTGSVGVRRIYATTNTVAHQTLTVANDIVEVDVFSGTSFEFTQTNSVVTIKIIMSGTIGTGNSYGNVLRLIRRVEIGENIAAVNWDTSGADGALPLIATGGQLPTAKFTVTGEADIFEITVLDQDNPTAIVNQIASRFKPLGTS